MERFLRHVGRRTTLVRIRSEFKVVKEDPKDDVVLSTANSGEAEHMVSGDKHLIHLRELGGTKIVTVSEMLDILKNRGRSM